MLIKVDALKLGKLTHVDSKCAQQPKNANKNVVLSCGSQTLTRNHDFKAQPRNDSCVGLLVARILATWSSTKTSWSLQLLPHHWGRWSHHRQENIETIPTPAMLIMCLLFSGPGKNIPFHAPQTLRIANFKWKTIVHPTIRGLYWGDGTPQRFHISGGFLIRKIEHHRLSKIVAQAARSNAQDYPPSAPNHVDLKALWPFFRPDTTPCLPMCTFFGKEIVNSTYKKYH